MHERIEKEIGLTEQLGHFCKPIREQVGPLIFLSLTVFNILNEKSTNDVGLF